jgi:hypothetical protein
MTRRSAKILATAVLAISALVTGVAPVAGVASSGPALNHPSDSVWD